jgi:heme/copper-type cytochrome/quinol oxidase subunit 4
MKEDLKDVFFSEWDALHGKKRYLSLLLAIILSALAYLIIVFMREHFSYEIYQLFVLGVIFLVVIAFGILGREKIKKDRKSDI